MLPSEKLAELKGRGEPIPDWLHVLIAREEADVDAVRKAGPISAAIGGHDMPAENSVVGWLARGIMGGATLLARALHMGAPLHPEMVAPLIEALQTLRGTIERRKQ